MGGVFSHIERFISKFDGGIELCTAVHQFLRSELYTKQFFMQLANKLRRLLQRLGRIALDLVRYANPFKIKRREDTVNFIDMVCRSEIHPPDRIRVLAALDKQGVQIGQIGFELDITGTGQTAKPKFYIFQIEKTFHVNIEIAKRTKLVHDLLALLDLAFDLTLTVHQACYFAKVYIRLFLQIFQRLLFPGSLIERNFFSRHLHHV